MPPRPLRHRQLPHGHLRRRLRVAARCWDSTGHTPPRCRVEVRDPSPANAQQCDPNNSQKRSGISEIQCISGLTPEPVIIEAALPMPRLPARTRQPHLHQTRIQLRRQRPAKPLTAEGRCPKTRTHTPPPPTTPKAHTPDTASRARSHPTHHSTAEAATRRPSPHPTSPPTPTTAPSHHLSPAEPPTPAPPNRSPTPNDPHGRPAPPPRRPPSPCDAAHPHQTHRRSWLCCPCTGKSRQPDSKLPLPWPTYIEQRYDILQNHRSQRIRKRQSARGRLWKTSRCS